MPRIGSREEGEAASEGAPLVHESINMSENDAAYFGIRPQHGTNVCDRPVVLWALSEWQRHVVGGTQGCRRRKEFRRAFRLIAAARRANP